MATANLAVSRKSVSLFGTSRQVDCLFIVTVKNLGVALTRPAAGALQVARLSQLDCSRKLSDLA